MSGEFSFQVVLVFWALIFAKSCWRGGTKFFASTTSSPARVATSSVFSSHKNFELLRHDVTHPLFVEVDEIFNLACPASPIHYKQDPVQTTKTSVLGAINMLGLAKRLN